MATFPASWRGVVGVIKPTLRPGSLEEFIRLLPEGIGVIPTFMGVSQGVASEFLDRMALMKEKIAELAAHKVDLIHPEGAPFFTHMGYQRAREIVAELEAEYSTPIVTTAMTLVEASRALGVRRMVIASSFADAEGIRFQKHTEYFRAAGFDVLAIEGMPVKFSDIAKLSPEEVYVFAKKLHLRHPGADGICMMGSGWRVLNIVPLLEQDLQVPVIHPVAARVWAVQKRLRVRQPVKGFGRLLEEMP
ncbi:MAG TPA: hypothetical protein VNL14_02940 [Candidatus Acidoferrales bacterium]|nr:hypothetical protein [Candidatus Acidoferrales bacterium]